MFYWNNELTEGTPGIPPQEGKKEGKNNIIRMMNEKV
jgi:hypothetical protein